MDFGSIPPPPAPRLEAITHDLGAMVNSLFIPSFSYWNAGLVRDLFVETNADWILNYSTPCNAEDKLTWTPNSKGVFFPLSPPTSFFLFLPETWLFLFLLLTRKIVEGSFAGSA